MQKACLEQNPASSPRFWYESCDDPWVSICTIQANLVHGVNDSERASEKPIPSPDHGSSLAIVQTLISSPMQAKANESPVQAALHMESRPTWIRSIPVGLWQ